MAEVYKCKILSPRTLVKFRQENLNEIYTFKYKIML